MRKEEERKRETETLRVMHVEAAKKAEKKKRETSRSGSW